MNIENGKISKKRALLKLSVVLAAIFFLVGGLAHFIGGEQLDALKHNLDLRTIIALVVIINLVSFGCFLILFVAYQWVRGDLKPRRDDDIP